MKSDCEGNINSSSRLAWVVCDEKEDLRLGFARQNNSDSVVLQHLHRYVNLSSATSRNHSLAV